MTREDRFSRLVENMYKAALAEGRWISVAGLINDVTSTFGHSLTYVDVGPGGQSDIWLSQFFVDSERREDLRQLYFGDYYKRDEAIPRLAGLRDGELVHKSNLYTDREKRKSAVYAFRTRHRTEDGLFMGIDGLDGTAVVWSYGNSTCRDGWGHDQIKTIKRLAPHIRQFSRVRRAMANACALGASLAQLLENKRLGLIQLDGRGRILEANDRARDVLLKPRRAARRPGHSGCSAQRGKRRAAAPAGASVPALWRPGHRRLDEDHPDRDSGSAGP